MPNMPDINKKFVNSLLSIELVAKIKKRAKELGMTTTELISFLLDRELSTTVLTAEDYEWIAAQVRKNLSKRK